MTLIDKTLIDKTRNGTPRIDLRAVTRRRALGLAAGLTVGAVTQASAQDGVGAPAVLRRDLAVERDVIIVGAGAAGLAAAAECVRQGLSSLCIEARDRVGGRIFTDSSLGAPFDAGALFLHWAERNPWRDEARRLGAALVDEPAGSFRVVTGSETSPEQGQRRRGQFRRLSTLLEGAGVPDLSVAEIASREGLSDAAGGLTRMALGEEPARVSARDYARLWSGDDLIAPDGFGRLVTAFARGLEVRTGVAALGVAWDGAGVSVETTVGTARARVAIVTLPVGVLKAGAVAFRPALPAPTLRALDGLEMGVLSKIALTFEGERFGMDGPADIILAQGDTLIDFDCWAFGRPLVVGYVGGDGAREMARLGPDGAVAAALDAFTVAVGGEARRRFRGGRFHGWIDDPLARGAYSHALPGQAGARAALAAPVGDRLIFAGEATGGEGGDFGGAMTAGGAYLAGRDAARAAGRLIRGGR